MSLAALIALVYGLGLAWTGWREKRRGGHPLPLIGGGGLGAVAFLGGALLLAGDAAGRGLALLAAILAALFFGWMVSRAIVEARLAAGPLGGFLASLATAAVLILGSRGGTP